MRQSKNEFSVRLTAIALQNTVRSMSRCRSSVALAAVLLILIASINTTASGLRCVQCGPHCPMSAKHLGCHDHGTPAHGHGCHDRSGAQIASCTHTGETADGLSWLAIPLPHVLLAAAVPPSESVAEAAVRVDHDASEPPTEPPRLSVAA